MSLDALMVNSLTLERKVIVRGQTGTQQTTVFVTDPGAVDVPCSIQPMSARTQLWYMQRQMRLTHTIYFACNYNPSTRDRWAIGDRLFVIEGWYNSLEIDDTWVCDAYEGKRDPATNECIC